MPNWYQKHLAAVAANAKKIDMIYFWAAKEASQIGATISNFNPNKPFSFADYPITKNRIDSLTQTMQTSIHAVVVNGVTAAWENSNFANNDLARGILGHAPTATGTVDLFSALQPAAAAKLETKYFNNNADALKAFIQRKDAGLGLSDRVWKQTQQFKQELEMTLDSGIRNGQGAASMARDVRQFLNEPDRVYRRFQMHLRDDAGNPVLDQAGNKIIIKQLRKQTIDPATGLATWNVENPPYKPGQGIYKSSYKNAHRLARTEQNMAYRTSDHTRMQQLDFVVGIEIRPSKNHPVSDICDTLAGKYPKEFKFSGWHPQCRDTVIQILKTRDELIQDTQKILSGTPTDTNSVNRIDKVPDNFMQWAEQNRERIANGKSVPYFVRDNFKAGDITKGISLIKPAVDPAIAIQAKLMAIEEEATKGITNNLEIGEEIDITGWRKETSGVGTAGTFYYPHDATKYGIVYKPKELAFKNALKVGNQKVEDYDGLTLEYLFHKWNPDYPIAQNAKMLGMETGQLMDKIVVRQAIEKGYDGLIMGDLEIIDLRTSPYFKAGKLEAPLKAAKAKAKAKATIAADTIKAAQQAALDAKNSVTQGKVKYYQELASKKLAEAVDMEITAKEFNELAAVIGDDKVTYSQIKGKIDKLNIVVNAKKDAIKAAVAHVAKAAEAAAKAAEIAAQEAAAKATEAAAKTAQQAANNAAKAAVKAKYEALKAKKIGAVDPLSDESLLTKFSQEEIDKLHKAHAQFTNNISGLDLAGQIKKTTYEIDWLVDKGTYSTSSTLSQILKKDLVALKAKQGYEITINEAKALISQNSYKPGMPTSLDVAKAIVKLEKGIQGQATTSEIESAMADLSAKAHAFKVEQAAINAKNIKTASIEDFVFFESEKDPFSLTKYYTAAEKAEVRRLRDGLQEAIKYSKGNIRNTSVMEASDELDLALERLGTKYLQKQKSFKHLTAKVTSSDAEFSYITDAQAKAAYDAYINLNGVKGQYSNKIGGVFEAEGSDLNRIIKYKAKIGKAGTALGEELSMPYRYTSGSTFINEWLTGRNPYPDSQYLPALKNFTAAFSHAMNKLPRYNGYSYRGLDKIDSLWNDLLTAAKNKTPFTHKAGISTSTDVQRSDAFGTDITLKIYGKSGVRVQEFSAFENEKEVIYRPGTQFEVVEMYESQTDNDIAKRGKWTVVLREILR